MINNDGGHVYDYLYRGPHPFDAYPPARWPAGVLEEVPDNETEPQREQRERRETYRACRVMGGRPLMPADLDYGRVDRHIEACIARGLVRPYEWALEGLVVDDSAP